MKKRERLKSLTWKYFWEQKWDEVKSFLLFLIQVVWGLSIVLSLAATPHIFRYGVNHIFEKAVVIYGIIHLIGLIIFCIYKWISNNWQKAKYRAKYGKDSLEGDWCI